MAASTSSIDLTESFPVRYVEDFGCSDDSELQKQIEYVASFVSKVYAKFPQLGEGERTQLRKEGVWIHPSKQLPLASDCQAFELALKLRIIKDLTQKEVSQCSIKLSTACFPEGVLQEIAGSVFKQKMESDFLFPYRTCTRICLKEEKKKLSLDMNFQSLPLL